MRAITDLLASTRRPAAVCTLSLLTAVAGCSRDDTQLEAPAALAEPGYRAEVVRTTYGVAHITADDFGSLGYGEGFAAAQDHVCNIAYALMSARGERARYLGAGEDNAHLISDAVVRAMDIRGQARRALKQQPEEIVDWLGGYVAGYNRFLAEEGPSETSWCSGADWVQPATAEDFKARMVLVAQTLPQMPAALAAAQPPVTPETSPGAGSETSAGTAALTVSGPQLAAAQQALRLEGMGSNAWALGSERTENGRGMLLGNPHYPWYGDRRFWEKHLIIPGRLDVYGVHLLGAPGVSIGFNRAVGWSHTVSASQRVVFYQLELVPGNPLQYRYGDEVRSIRAETVTVPVLQADGSVAEHEHTLYFSHYGPMITLPGMGWSAGTAFSARDANRNNDRLLAQWQAMNLATDMDSFIEAHRRSNALPWVNTMAASADGRALYLDDSTVGHLSEQAIAAWRQRLQDDPLTAGLYAERGMVLLDGSDPQNEWVEDEAATLPGTVPFDQRPQLERRDFVFNANDSYWLSNPAQPLSGYSPLYGPTGTARSLRTRMNIRLLEADSPYGFAGEDGRFSLEEIQRALFANQSLAAELLLPELLEACSTQGEVLIEGERVAIDEACAVLSRFDGRMDEDSEGAVLFREWLADYPYPETLRAGELFAQPFSEDAPVGTPAGLADRERALQALGRAVQVLAAAGLGLDAPLGAAQAAYRGPQRIPVHGGNRREGVANLQVSGNPGHPLATMDSTPVGGSRLMTASGYPVMHGSSFILTLRFDDEGPVAQALLSYSQSGDPGSPWFSDQTELYRAKQWRDIAFEADAIRDSTVSKVELTGPR